MGLLSTAAPIGEALKLANTILGPIFNRGHRESPRAETPTFAQTLQQSLQSAEISARNTIESHDMNHDGFLTSDELGVDPQSFARMDANADGRLDSAELTRAYANKTYTTSQ